MADQLIAILGKGRCDVESFARGRWHQATHLTGGPGMTAPATGSGLRRRGAGAHEALHLHIPVAAMPAAAEEVRPEAVGPPAFPNHRRSHAPVVSTVTTSLERALRDGAPDLYAEAAVALMCCSPGASEDDDAPTSP